MTRYLPALIVSLALISTPIWAQNISDVATKDSTYMAISKSIKSGYLPLYSDNSFLPEQAVSRRELAVVIEKILSESDESTLTLSKNDIQEVKQLLKAFKSVMGKTESTLDSHSEQLEKIKSEQKVINTDVSRFSDEWNQKLQTLKKEQQDQNLYMWLGIAAAAFLGMAIK
jgi:hypothetical protein